MFLHPPNVVGCYDLSREELLERIGFCLDSFLFHKEMSSQEEKNNQSKFHKEMAANYLDAAQLIEAILVLRSLRGQHVLLDPRKVLGNDFSIN